MRPSPEGTVTGEAFALYRRIVEIDRAQRGEDRMNFRYRQERFNEQDLPPVDLAGLLRAATDAEDRWTVHIPPDPKLAEQIRSLLEDDRLPDGRRADLDGRITSRITNYIRDLPAGGLAGLFTVGDALVDLIRTLDPDAGPWPTAQMDPDEADRCRAFVAAHWLATRDLNEAVAAYAERAGDGVRRALRWAADAEAATDLLAVRGDPAHGAWRAQCAAEAATEAATVEAVLEAPETAGPPPSIRPQIDAWIASFKEAMRAAPERARWAAVRYQVHWQGPAIFALARLMGTEGALPETGLARARFAPPYWRGGRHLVPGSDDGPIRLESALWAVEGGLEAYLAAIVRRDGGAVPRATLAHGEEAMRPAMLALLSEFGRTGRRR